MPRQNPLPPITANRVIGLANKLLIGLANKLLIGLANKLLIGLANKLLVDVRRSTLRPLQSTLESNPPIEHQLQAGA